MCSWAAVLSYLLYRVVFAMAVPCRRELAAEKQIDPDLCKLIEKGEPVVLSANLLKSLGRSGDKRCYEEHARSERRIWGIAQFET